jgi:hypothetical protein
MGNANLVRTLPPHIGSPTALTLRAARADDVAAIMAIERLHGYERCVGQSEEAAHRMTLASLPTSIAWARLAAGLFEPE